DFVGVRGWGQPRDGHKAEQEGGYFQGDRFAEPAIREHHRTYPSSTDRPNRKAGSPCGEPAPIDTPTGAPTSAPWRGERRPRSPPRATSPGGPPSTCRR